jgi:mono/diheme cytochrome c family protein
VSILISRFRLLILAIVTMGCVAPLVASQAATAPSRAAIERGRATYEQNCTACHGNRGKGDAPDAWKMNPRPANLTTLTKRYGTFPAERVEAILKGTDQTKAHAPGMTVWRALFLADANGDEASANARVKDVVTYIASLQPK